ncbi:acetyltransferase [Actinacidiphila acididurans]|uniref:Acetyltransferase n=1 Tax=Actinacidiphila acididurans TaxID=2784346 RepID=A0ABS2TJL1_9ACTN|nr:acetyltransferase [Actinacidiphila acididurans]MBM9503535.1 acetyltransferase [Actinacidiphila acididurans]
MSAYGGRSGGPAEDLLIVGSGGFGRETAQAVADVNAALGAPRWRLLGFLDDDPARHGSRVDGLPVLGDSGLVHRMPEAKVLVCVGSPRGYAARARLVRRLDLPPQRYATVVHPTAAVSGSSVIGPGSVLLAHCVLTAAVWVGAHVAVMPHTVLTHDDVVADFVTLASGVRLGGGARLERGAYIGAGALIREYATVGAWSLIGMGSTVLADVPPGEVWAGTPARRLRAAGDAELAELATGPVRGDDTRAPGGTGDGGGIAADDLDGTGGHDTDADDRTGTRSDFGGNAPHRTDPDTAARNDADPYATGTRTGIDRHDPHGTGPENAHRNDAGTDSIGHDATSSRDGASAYRTGTSTTFGGHEPHRTGPDTDPHSGNGNGNGRNHPHRTGRDGAVADRGRQTSDTGARPDLRMGSPAL